MRFQAQNQDQTKALIEDAIVLLGNANSRLNTWRQKRFAEFLTDVGPYIFHSAQKPYIYCEKH